MLYMLSVTTLTACAEGSGHDRAGSSATDAGQLLVLCDGAGGSGGAAEAAEAVCSHFFRLHPPRTSVRADLVDWIGWIDRHLSGLGVHGLTTCVVAAVHDGIVEGASVGDSEAWLISDDDCLVLTEHQARRPLVGSRRSRPVAFGPVALNGSLVLGSDGLFKYCPRERILSTVRSHSPKEAAEQLLRAVRLAGGQLQDDFSVVVCAQVGRPAASSCSRLG